MIELYCSSRNTTKADELMIEAERLIMAEQLGDMSSSRKNAFDEIDPIGDALTENSVENLYFDANRSSDVTIMNDTTRHRMTM